MSEYSLLLRILDKYPMRVPVKGSFVNWEPKTIIITAPFSPNKMFENVGEPLN